MSAIAETKEELAVRLINVFEKIKTSGKSETFKINGIVLNDKTKAGRIRISYNHQSNDIGTGSDHLTANQMNCFNNAVELLKSDLNNTTEAIKILSEYFYLSIVLGLGK